MDLELTGKTVLVTGATRGIGKATAQAFAREGCLVHLAGRSHAELETAASALPGAGKHQIHVGDLCDRGDRATLVKACKEVDILVNNAGATPTGPIEAVDEDEWREGLELKVVATVALTKMIYERMKSRGSGVIVNVIGNCGERPDPDIIIATVTNTGMMGFTRALGSISPKHGVRVVGVNPGPTSTDRLIYIMQEKARDRTGDPDRWEELVAPLPFARASTPQEQADMILFAASPRSSYVSGTILTVDGGVAWRGHLF